MSNVAFRVCNDKPKLHIQTLPISGVGLVVYANRSMQQVWLISFMAWEMFRDFCGVIEGLLLQGRGFNLSAPDVSRSFNSRLVVTLNEYLRELQNAEHLPEAWPAEVPIPTEDRQNFSADEHHAAYEFACVGLGFILLHEAKHALINIAGQAFESIDEELECDKFGAEMILSPPADDARLRLKRALGVFVGLTVVLESTDVGVTRESQTHPTWVQRVNSVLPFIKTYGFPQNHEFWVFATSIMLSKLRRMGLDMPNTDFSSEEDPFYKVLEELSRRQSASPA
jgi:hypothetical protein